MTSRSPLAAQLLRVGPPAGAHRVALRASVSVLVPLLVLWAIGRQELSIYATFGAFTSLYGRAHGPAVPGPDAGDPRPAADRFGHARHRGRDVPAPGLARHPGRGAGRRVRLAGLGRPGVAPAGAAVPGVLLRGLRLALHRRPGRGAQRPGRGHVGGVRAARRRVGRAPAPVARPRPAPRTSRARPSYAGVARRHVARNACGVLVAGLVATASGIGHPYWAMVSAAVPLAARDLLPQVVRGAAPDHRYGRSASVVAAALLALGLGDLALILVVVALQAAAELLVGRNYALALVAITPLALLMVHLAAPVPAAVLLADRGVETVIGVSVGLAVGWLTRAPRTAG